MKFSELTQEDQNLISSFIDTLFRPTQGLINRVFNQVQHLIDSSNSGVLDILNSLEQDEIVPNTSNLAGAQLLTPIEIVSALKNYDSVLKSFNSDDFRKARIKAAGFSATNV